MPVNSCLSAATNAQASCVRLCLLMQSHVLSQTGRYMSLRCPKRRNFWSSAGALSSSYTACSLCKCALCMPHSDTTLATPHHRASCSRSCVHGHIDMDASAQRCCHKPVPLAVPVVAGQEGKITCSAYSLCSARAVVRSPPSLPRTSCLHKVSESRHCVF